MESVGFSKKIHRCKIKSEAKLRVLRWQPVYLSAADEIGRVHVHDILPIDKTISGMI